MKKTVIRILALVTLTACAGSCVSGCKKKKKSPFPEEDSFTTYTHSVEERKTADDIPLLADESEYLANIHDVPDHITFLPAEDEKLIDHYTVPADNIFGLKEIYVYENTVVTIFDQKTFDAPDYLYNFDRNPDWAASSWKEEDIEKNIIREFEDDEINAQQHLVAFGVGGDINNFAWQSPSYPHPLHSIKSPKLP